MASSVNYPMVRGIDQSIFERFVKKSIEDTVAEDSKDFGVVEIKGEWKYDKVASIKFPLVIRQCSNFVKFKSLFGPKQASKIFSVSFIFI